MPTRSDDSLFEDPSVDPRWRESRRRQIAQEWVAQDGSGLTGTSLKPVRDLLGARAILAGVRKKYVSHVPS